MQKICTSEVHDNGRLSWRKKMPTDNALEAGRGRPNSVTSCKLMFSVAKAAFADFFYEKKYWGKNLRLNKTTSGLFFFFQLTYVQEISSHPFMVWGSQFLCEMSEYFKAQHHHGAALCRVWENTLHARREGGTDSGPSGLKWSFQLLPGQLCLTAALLQDTGCIFLTSPEVAVHVSMGEVWPQHVWFSFSLNKYGKTLNYVKPCHLKNSIFRLQTGFLHLSVPG